MGRPGCKTNRRIKTTLVSLWNVSKVGYKNTKSTKIMALWWLFASFEQILDIVQAFLLFQGLPV